MEDILSEIDEALTVNETERSSESEESEKDYEDGKNDTSEEKETEKTEEDGEKEEGEKEKPEKKNRLQERFDKITRERYEWQRRAEEAERKLNSNAPKMPDRPDPKDFNTQQSYRDAVNRWEGKVEAWKEQQQENETAENNRKLQNVSSRIQAEKSKFKDFDSAISSISHLEMDNSLTNLVLNDPNGVEVLYELGKHPNIAIQLSLKDSVERARLLGVMSHKIELRNKGKTVSGAPKPPSKVNGGAKKEKHPGDMSPEEYVKWRKSQK